MSDQHGMSLLPVNQSSGVQQVWWHLTGCHSPADYKGSPSGAAAGLVVVVLAAAQLVTLNLWPDRILSGPLELDPARHQTLPQGSGMSSLQHKLISSFSYCNKS
jgi:hypothetical protein